MRNDNSVAPFESSNSLYVWYNKNMLTLNNYLAYQKHCFSFNTPTQNKI